jgi:L-lactate dehydrogenase complex protein LldG
MDGLSHRASAGGAVVSALVGVTPGEDAMSGADVLGRLHAVTADSPGLPTLPAPQRFDDPMALFMDRARQVGVQTDLVASVADAAERVADRCRRHDITCAAVWTTPDIAPLVRHLRTLGIEILMPGASADDLACAHIGITEADWGIAETGTLVLSCGPDAPRLTSLLPPRHLAVLRADRILPDLHALFQRVDTLPSALTFITGPSRSADIGLVPVLGAHGPVEVTVLIIRPDDVTAAQRNT